MADDLDLDVDVAQAVLAAQPFNTVVGAEITVFGDQAAVLRLDIGDRHRQQYGLVHGGVYACLADNAVTFAAGTVLGANVITTAVAINYLHGARHGVLEARARVVHHDARHAVCVAEIHIIDDTNHETLCAIAHGTVMATRTNSAGP